MRSDQASNSWTFAGVGCDRARITSVHVTIPGESLDNNGYYRCRDRALGLDGVVLHNFVGGTYNFTIEGLYSDSDAPVFVGSSSFKMDGGSEVDIDLGIKPQVPSSSGTKMSSQWSRCFESPCSWW